MNKLTITAEVTADTGAGTLDVKDHGRAISILREADPTTLVWTLTGAGPNAAFNPIDLSGPDSGFSWVGRSDGSSPSGFKKPTLSASRHRITMEDMNDGSGTAGGPYCYQLRALVDGVPCSTTVSVSTRGTVNNPAIENK